MIIITKTITKLIIKIVEKLEDSFSEELIQFLFLSKENPSLHESQLGEVSENGPSEHVEHLV